MTKVNFVSVASMDTGKALGAILLPFPDKLDLKTYRIEPDGKGEMELGHFYSATEMSEMNFESEETTSGQG